MTTPTFFLIQVQKPILEWSHHLTNHVWWSAAKCGGDPNLLLEMIKSMKYHIVNVHNKDFYGHELFHPCSHEQILRFVFRFFLTMFSWIALNFLSVQTYRASYRSRSTGPVIGPDLPGQWSVRVYRASDRSISSGPVIGLFFQGQLSVQPCQLRYWSVYFILLYTSITKYSCSNPLFKSAVCQKSTATKTLCCGIDYQNRLKATKGFSNFRKWTKITPPSLGRARLLSCALLLPPRALRLN